MEPYRESPHLLPVSYSDEYPQYSINDFLHDKMKVIEQMAIHKGRQWEHEEEWRIIFPKHGVTRKMPWPICEIIFGHRMEKAHKNTIYHLLGGEGTDIEFFEAIPSENNYTLDLQPFTKPATPML